MPHQLRRIIAINIRNATTGLPSEKVAEMDLRGSTLAVGPNGAGKTTFLRLLPLFYGATPQQILRGSGRSSLIAYSLPSASSAVAFEYERESATDLRCVVMHCEAGEDRPVFRIIENGGFKEEYFYDEEGYFISREDFPARAERLGAQLSQKLPLNLYRAVILKERLHTKEGQRVRDLAQRHSLGARSLSNLDQIAAAMANEKISFADLRNIVIDRVSDMGVADRPNVNARELRKSRKDVVRWIEDLDHAHQVMDQAPLAQSVKNTIDRVQARHRQMCALHLAVREALRQVQKEQANLRAEESAAQEQLQQQARRIQDALTKCATELVAARQRHGEAVVEYDSATSRLAYFTSIDVGAMASRQDQEAAFSSRKATAELECARLTEGSGQVRESAELRRSAIKQAAARQHREIGERELQAANSVAERLAANHEDQNATLRGLIAPQRLTEIASEREANVLRLGELNGVIKQPVASGETLEKLDAARTALSTLEGQHLLAQGRQFEADAEVQRTRAALDRAILSVEQAQSARERALETAERLQRQLTPPPGSLLEYLRKKDAAAWAGVARVIDPGLLQRKDLSPEENALETGDPASVVVGPFVLDVRQVPQPDWVDEAQLREHIAAARVQVQHAEADLENANDAAKREQKAHSDAAEALVRCQTEVGLLSLSKDNAKGFLERMAVVAEQEANLQKQAAQAEIVRLQRKIVDLEVEGNQINARLNESRKAIEASFQAQREKLSDRSAAAEAFAAEHKGVEDRMQADLAQEDEDMAAQLQGLGIDPQRIQALNDTVSELGAWLDAIARNRHLVSQWSTFERDVLPRMEVLRIKNQTAREDVQRFEQAQSSAQADAVDFDRRQAEMFRAFADSQQRLEREENSLQVLLSSPLKDFLSLTVAPNVQTDWDVGGLEHDVRECKRALENATDELTTRTRKLRDVMTAHDSPVTHWIAQRERELPDSMTLLDHEARVARAQVLCDWFLPGEEARVSYFNQINQDMDGFLAVAGNFVQDLDIFESRVRTFNKDLQAALQPVSGFRRFKDLSVEVLSSMGQIGAIGTLRQMQQVLDSKTSSYGAFSVRRRDLPTQEEAALIRRFREILPADGVLRINLNEQVRLECALTEGGQRRVISNDEEFRAVSSNGNTALIVAMFLIGFLEMVRKKDSGVRITWLTDECGRFDAGNLREFLHVLDVHSIDVISAAPSADPAQARYFQRLCIFEETGVIATTENTSHAPVDQGVHHVRA